MSKITEKIVLDYREEDTVFFICTIDQLSNYDARVNVEKVTSWTLDNKLILEETELYLEFYLEWNGCSSLTLHQTHFCGVKDYRRYVLFIEWLHKTVSALISNYVAYEKWV